MLTVLWNLISRVFVFILLGYIIDRIIGKKGEAVTRVFITFALYVLIPLFVFLSLWNNMIPVAVAGKITIAAILVTGIGAALTLLWARAAKKPFRCLCLPVIFMNSAYLAIPVNTQLWGAEGTTATILYNLAITVLNFTFGIWCVSREKPLSEILELPVIMPLP
jgi:predicted permease